MAEERGTVERGSEARVRPFANGSEFDAWNGVNCQHCAKYDPENADPSNCEIDYQVGAAYIGDGTVPREIAERMGYFDANPPGQLPALGWPCPERKARA